jgi:hypothetical protein
MLLGRKPHDPLRVAAHPARRLGLAKPPPSQINRSKVPFAPGLYGNDTLPDCTAVTTVNMARAFSWVNAGCDIAVQAAKVPAFYALCVGCASTQTAMAATDGAAVLNVLERASAGVSEPLDGLASQL